jgi:hypothetical protein
MAVSQEISLIDLEVVVQFLKKIGTLKVEASRSRKAIGNLATRVQVKKVVIGSFRHPPLRWFLDCRHTDKLVTILIGSLILE